MAVKIDKKAVEAQIDAIKEGGVAKFKCPESIGGEIVWVELNKGKGKKYLLSLEDTTGGKPTGKKNSLVDFDKPKDIANWVSKNMAAPLQ